MNRSFAARGVLVTLLVLGVGVAALAWWLFSSGRLDGLLASKGSLAPTARETPAARPGSQTSAPSPDKSAPAAITEANKALKDIGARLGVSTPASSDPAPAFDVARIEPDGEAVIAGRAIANSTVELLADGRVHDRTTADSSGAFVFVPKPLPPGNYEIKLRTTAPDGKVMVSKKAVAVSLQAKDGPAVAALTGPKAPAVTTVAPQAPAAGAAASKPGDDVASKPGSKEAELRIEAMEPEAGGGLFVSGRAAPGARVRLYMNDGFIATGTASAEGRVAFSIRSGVRPGDYRIRLEQMTASDRVVSRVEKPFRAPATIASTAASAPHQSPGSPAAQEPVVASRAPEREPAPVASQESSPRNAQPARQSPPPVASVPQAKPDAGSRPAQVASKPAAEADARIASREKADAAASMPSADKPAPGGSSVPALAASQPAAHAPGQPVTQSPVAGTSKPEPGNADRMPPRVARADRRDAVVIPRIDTRQIVRGDNLWRISEATYGFGQRYTVIFGANRDKIRDPDLIYPGQIFVLPKAKQ